MMEKNLKNLVIHRFRGIWNLNLTDIGRINLLVGSNNSGKTSVLEAISTYCRPMDPFEWLNTARRREIKSSRIPWLDALKWLFPQRCEAKEGELYQGETFISGSGQFNALESNAIYREFLSADETNEKPLIENGLDEEDEGEENSWLPGTIRRGIDLELKITYRTNQPSLFDDKREKKVSNTFQLWEDERFISRRTPPGPMLSVATITPFSHRVEQIQISQLTEATFKGAKNKALKILRQLDPGIKDLVILSKEGIRPTLYIQHDEVGLAPLSAFGDGVRCALTIALILPSVANGVLLIDEIETAIHTSALRDIFHWLIGACERNNVQLFATTHSLEALDVMLQVAMDEEDNDKDKDMVVYRLERTTDQTNAIRLDCNALATLRLDLGQEVR